MRGMCCRRLPAVLPLILVLGCSRGSRPDGDSAFRLGDAVVVVARREDPDERQQLTEAAADLTNVIFHVTGWCAPIYGEGKEPKDAKVILYVGACDAAKSAGIAGADLRNGDWRVKTVPGKAFLYGKTPWGAQGAVVEFAERFCDHWTVAVDGYDVFVRRPDLTIPLADVTVRPAIYSRELYHGMYSARNPTTKEAWSRFCRMSRAVIVD